MNFKLIKTENFTYYERKSPECNKNIIFIHGFATTSDYHNNFLRHLKNKFNYYAICLPGHGVAEVKDKKILSPLNLAKHIVEWIKFMNLENVYLIGHSMGGGISLLISNMMPNYFKKIVAVTPMNPSFSFKHLNIIKFVPKNKEQTFRMQHFILKDVQKFYKDENDNGIIKETEYQLKNREEFCYLRSNMMKPSNLINLRKAIKNTSYEIMIILGKHDNIIDPKSAFKYFSKFNKFKIVNFENSAHLPFWEEPEKYTKTILEYFEQDKND